MVPTFFGGGNCSSFRCVFSGPRRSHLLSVSCGSKWNPLNQFALLLNLTDAFDSVGHNISLLYGVLYLHLRLCCQTPAHWFIFSHFHKNKLFLWTLVNLKDLCWFVHILLIGLLLKTYYTTDVNWKQSNPLRFSQKQMDYCYNGIFLQNSRF